MSSDNPPTATPQVVRTVAQVAGAALLLSVALVAYMAHQIAAQGARDERSACTGEGASCDAIVVLGAAQLNGRPSDVFRARLEHAVELWKDGLAPYLVVTGGRLPNDATTEAAVARQWAIDHGVPPDAILGEDRGRTTLESLEAVGAIFRGRRFERGLFVSDETHMLRVLRMASDQGIQAWGSPTRTSPTDLDPGRRRRAMLHELAGLAAYYVGGGRLLDDTVLARSP